MAKEFVNGPCTVCTLLDGNTTRTEVYWCNTCQAHICKSCDHDWVKRGKAFLIKKGLLKK